MSTLAPAPPGACRRDVARPARSLWHDLGGEPTLDELLTGVWEGLAAHRPMPCPICGAEMRPVYGGHALEGGHCAGCDARLS